eukprot:6484697-Pyramimonas_sp.AAC.1
MPLRTRRTCRLRRVHLWSARDTHAASHLLAHALGQPGDPAAPFVHAVGCSATLKVLSQTNLADGPKVVADVDGQGVPGKPVTTGAANDAAGYLAARAKQI